MVIAAMKEEQFLIVTHQEVKDLLMYRGQDIDKLEEHLKSVAISRRKALEKKKSGQQKPD